MFYFGLISDRYMGCYFDCQKPLEFAERLPLRLMLPVGLCPVFGRLIGGSVANSFVIYNFYNKCELITTIKSTISNRIMKRSTDQAAIYPLNAFIRFSAGTSYRCLMTPFQPAVKSLRPQQIGSDAFCEWLTISLKMFVFDYFGYSRMLRFS